jgi:hypothetical protein
LLQVYLLSYESHIFLLIYYYEYATQKETLYII